MKGWRSAKHRHYLETMTIKVIEPLENERLKADSFLRAVGVDGVKVVIDRSLYTVTVPGAIYILPSDKELGQRVDEIAKHHGFRDNDDSN